MRKLSVISGASRGGGGGGLYLAKKIRPKWPKIVFTPSQKAKAR